MFFKSVGVTGLAQTLKFSGSHYSVPLLVLIHNWMYSTYTCVLLHAVFCYMCKNIFCDSSQFCNYTIALRP